MTTPHLMKPKEAAKILGVNDEMLCHWSQTGDLGCICTPGGHRLYDLNTILPQKFINPPTSSEEKKDYLYARVSSRKQKEAGDLQRQIELLKEKFPNYEIITDIGSGIGFKRPGLRKILHMVFKGKVRHIVVEHRD
jgi:putative resolvase